LGHGTTCEFAGRQPARDVRLGRYVFKPAGTRDELEQLHRLNHATFVREVPQHAARDDGRLVDKFHDRNLYFVALEGPRVVGMLALHDQPPFSIADKLADASVLQRLGARPLEVRLLAIEPGHRHGAVFAGLGLCVLRHAQRGGYSHLLISGVFKRLRMYERIGFRAIGPAAGSGDARFVPMATPVGELPAHILADLSRIERWADASRDMSQDPPRETLRAAEFTTEHGAEHSTERGAEPAAVVSLTPGHSQLAPEVLAALSLPGIDHRSDAFAALHAGIRAQLAELAGAAPPALFCGSGTLANDVVAATLAADRRLHRGLVLVNGEFGRRLSVQATRAGLRHEVLAWEWGRPWDLAEIARALDARHRPDWVWAVHLESSTGMLNDLAPLCAAARGRGVRVCVDAISSLGAVPLDLAGVHLATGVASKALGGVAGLSLVYAAPHALDGVDTSRVPTYLDLGATLACDGPRFTLSSNLLRVLDAALRPYADDAARRRRFAESARLGRFVRAQLRTLGLTPLVPEEHASPVITSFPPPPHVPAEELLARCRAAGFGLGGSSGYLRARGWLQIATMGHVLPSDAQRLFALLGVWSAEWAARNS